MGAKVTEENRTIPRDEYGPETVLTVYDPALGMEGYLVIDNTAIGLGKGGIRMTPDVTPEEVYRLARTMTWKNSLAGIPFGGAKAGIRAPERAKGESDTEYIQRKKAFVQSFARAVSVFTPKRYVAGPDVGTGERDMQWFVEATGNWRSATGKPANYCMKMFGRPGEKCGLPHEFGSTGFGVAHAARVAADIAGIELKGARVAIHGFGNVGTFAFKILSEMGAKVVAVANAHESIVYEAGFDPGKMDELLSSNEHLSRYPGARIISSRDFWAVPTDVLVPASVTDVITDDNKGLIRTKLIVEGGNIPMQVRIEEELERKGILVVPDFVANAGGVISSYAEYRGYNPKRMFDLVERRIVAATKKVLVAARKHRKPARVVAEEIARVRVDRAMAKRKETFKKR